MNGCDKTEYRYFMPEASEPKETDLREIFRFCDDSQAMSRLADSSP